MECKAENTNDIEAKLTEFLKENKLNFKAITCLGGKRYCINLDYDRDHNMCYCKSDIIVHTSSKGVCRIHPYQIIYIAKEKRKCAVYIDGKRIETNYSLNYFKNKLNSPMFAQPHSSYLVNLCYVEEVTKDFVKIKHKGKNYSVYTSERKLNGFKKAFLEYNK